MKGLVKIDGLHDLIIVRVREFSFQDSVNAKLQSPSLIAIRLTLSSQRLKIDGNVLHNYGNFSIHVTKTICFQCASWLHFSSFAENRRLCMNGSRKFSTISPNICQLHGMNSRFPTQCCMFSSLHVFRRLCAVAGAGHSPLGGAAHGWRRSAHGPGTSPTGARPGHVSGRRLATPGQGLSVPHLR